MAGADRTFAVPLPIVAAGLLVCFASAVGLQIARDRAYPNRERETERILYVRSPSVVKRLALGFDALAADVYWIRAIQHYGGDRLSNRQPGGPGSHVRRYELLNPLLDLTTGLDPYFTIAYRFGAIFLSEAAPGGPGRPDLAIALLEKGRAVQPEKWQYVHDLAFVYFWHLRDTTTAASLFQEAAALPNSPNWLKLLAAGMYTAGNDRAKARSLWTQMLDSDEEWIRRNAKRSLLQIEALDAIDKLNQIVRQVRLAPGVQYSWRLLVANRILRDVPPDPSGTAFDIDPATGVVTLSKTSALYPLPSLP